MPQQIEVKGLVRRTYCVGETCPLRLVIDEARDRENIVIGMPLTEFKELCQAQGLTPANDTYGHSLTKDFREKAETLIFTADCVERKIEGRNCGSLIAASVIYQTKDVIEKVSADFIKKSWALKNPPKTIS